MEDVKDAKEEVTGTVESVVYRNEQNGYTILEVSTDKKELVTVVGTMPFVSEGENITVRGSYVVHSEYGRQLKADSFEKRIPEQPDAILKYLSSGVIKGIGPKTAEKIVEKYGADTFEVMSNHPDWLADFKGISPRRALEIGDEIRRQMGFYRLFDFCRDVVPMHVALRIYQNYGERAVEQLRTNPYALCGKIRGFSFTAADQIAMGAGGAPDARERVLGATVRVLERACETGGHACLPVKQVVIEVASLLELDPKEVAEHEKDFVLEKQIGYLHRKADSLLYINRFYEAERSIAGRLLQLDRACVRYRVEDMEPLVNRAMLESGLEYAAMQRKAIFEAASSGVLIITGGPGTGKTTIIKALIRIYESMGCEVALAAPTGRAAKRMAESTACEARTIHRLLEVEFRDEADGDEGATFARNEHNLLDADIIIIDEASMIDMFLMQALLAAIRPGARLVLLGDCDQLPSVGAGNVLHDLINSGCFNIVRLTEIFRQGSESLIVTNAHRINRGEMPVTDARDKDFFFMKREGGALISTLAEVTAKRLPATYGVSAFDKIQVITPTRKGAAGTETLNQLLQAELNPPAKDKAEKKFRNVVFREGDKVMQIRNNYDLTWDEDGKERFGIYNGDIGVIGKIYDRQSYMMVSFDGREVKYGFDLLEDLELAYAITVHKSQGSEYPFVVMPVTDFPPMLMTRNLLYTAVTRAKTMAVLIGREDALSRMVENDRETVRYTGLCDMLQSAGESHV
ncbi:MAG: ATP-dependent RecD-like DNA helicase [Oscillospiraceae bacterium]|nr:MAG: ATP-dependent RecD-like DNA helicase [Oscillospiraceae bacterium]